MSGRAAEPHAVAEVARRLAPLRTSQPACCCRARPAVRVLIPSGPGRAAVVDLLLCGDHYRSGIPALERIGAVAFDSRGALLMPRSWASVSC